MSKIWWNAIVRNEAARIERCVNSLLPWVSGAAIVDTGSTDDTVEIIHRLFAQAGKPCLVDRVPFKNFSQARNAGLTFARCSPAWDWLLLVDADMELVVDDPQIFENLPLAPSWDAKQLAGEVEYYNRRLVHQSATGMYEGVTHEFLDIPSGGPIGGFHFIDHADGANRPNKTERDIALLENGLETETRPHIRARYWFYLGQSYREAGMWENCRDAYKNAVEQCTWDEERYVAQVNYANALRMLGDEAGFILQTLFAYNMRPSRKDCLYDLAKHFRERSGDTQKISLLFSEPCLNAKKPGDYLFVPDYPYSAGFKEEFSICAFYDDRTRIKGADLTSRMSLDKSLPGHVREQARQNMYWYLRPLKDWIGDYEVFTFPFASEPGWAPMNPSVVNWQGRIMAAVRTVNYVINEHGQYCIGDGSPYGEDNPIRTKTHIVELDEQFRLISSRNIHYTLPEPKYKWVRGLEDQRLFVCDDSLYTISCAREMNADGWPEQVLSRLDGPRIRWFDVLKKEPRECQKNWMPWSNCGHHIQFTYRLGRLIGQNGMFLNEDRSKQDYGFLGGGSQVVPFSQGRLLYPACGVVDRFLCAVHDARSGPDGKRYYNHRFVLLNIDGDVEAISPPFYLHERQIEYVMGLAWHPDNKRLLMSYGIRDAEAWIAVLNPDQVMEFLRA